MKVAMIGHKTIPSRCGGVEVAVGHLSESLSAAGVDIVAYNRSSDLDKKDGELRNVETRLVYAPRQKGLNATIYSYLATARAIKEGADIIHYHALGPAASLWMAKLFRKKVVVTVHGLNYKTPKWHGIGSLYIKFGEFITQRFADAVIVLSESTRQYFSEKYGRATFFFPNGISMEKADSYDVLERFGLRANSFLLCVSRLVPGKGLETLIEAYKKCRIDLPLVIVGDSEFVDEFKHKIKSLAADIDRVVFTGQLNKEDVTALYQSARLFIQPSEAEGMSLCLLEALWANCPCLVSDIPENTELLKESGSVFPVGNVNALSSAMQHMLSQCPAKTETRQRIERDYSWPNIAKMTASLYERVLDTNGGFFV